MSDIASASILQLESLAEGHELPTTHFKNETALLRGALSYAATNLPGGVLLPEEDPVDGLEFASERPLDFDAEQYSETKQNNAIAELEGQLANAVHEAHMDDAKRLLEQIRKHATDSLNQSLASNMEQGHVKHDASRDVSGAAEGKGNGGGGGDGDGDGDGDGKSAGAGAGASASTTEQDTREALEAPIRSSVSHQLWRALLTSSKDAICAAIAADLPDYSFVDDINARTALHFSTCAGQLELCKACVEHGVDPRASDVYGREALAYAAIFGFEDIAKYLLSLPESRDTHDHVVEHVDLDGFSPLLHAIVRGRTGIVRILLDFCALTGRAMQGKMENSDLSPLATAAQCGLVDITRLLLEHGAKVEVNTEGLLPQTLAARAGHTECLRLLLDAKVDVNAVEKGTLCTPLFYAAEFGHAACVEMLLAAGASIDDVDEKGRHAVFYAAWHGWRECTRMLLAAHATAAAKGAAQQQQQQQQQRADAGVQPMAPASTIQISESHADMDTDLDAEGDGIPSLHLPPPIIPFRTYGHNYLDKHSLLCLSLSKHSIELHRQSVSDRPDMFPGLATSFKLVLTPRNTNAGAQAGIPHTIIFPMAEEREEASFQVADLEHFYLECEIFPTFGSARIAKTVLLPELLNGLESRSHVQLPLFDWHLNLIGHIHVVLECVRPYSSVQLQIGGHVETYWKSTLPSHNQPLTVSPLPYPNGTHDAQDTALYVTASSLSGEYLNVNVHFTKDLVPVVCASRRLPVPVWAPFVSQVTATEFADIAEKTGHTWHTNESESLAMNEWSAKLSTTLVSLETLLVTLPPSVSVALQIVFDADATVVPLNACIDATLHVVYDVARREKHRRRLFFSSTMPSACVALNWKQPNYAVFFINNATLDADAAVLSLPEEADPRQSSMAEAVRFAKGNNLLGVMLDTSILECVPELITAVKAAGLVLITLRRPSSNASATDATSFSEPGFLGPPALACHDAIDGFLEGNVIKCTK